MSCLNYDGANCVMDRSGLKSCLGDVKKIDWLKPKAKSDKGAICLHIEGQFNLLLWCNKNLEEWMLMLKEAIQRNKLKRFCLMQHQQYLIRNASEASAGDQMILGQKLYENAPTVTAPSSNGAMIGRQSLEPISFHQLSRNKAIDANEEEKNSNKLDRSGTITKGKCINNTQINEVEKPADTKSTGSSGNTSSKSHRDGQSRGIDDATLELTAEKLPPQTPSASPPSSRSSAVPIVSGPNAESRDESQGTTSSHGSSPRTKTQAMGADDKGSIEREHGLSKRRSSSETLSTNPKSRQTCSDAGTTKDEVSQPNEDGSAQAEPMCRANKERADAPMINGTVCAEDNQHKQARGARRRSGSPASSSSGRAEKEGKRRSLNGQVQDGPGSRGGKEWTKEAKSSSVQRDDLSKDETQGDASRGSSAIQNDSKQAGEKLDNCERPGDESCVTAVGQANVKGARESRRSSRKLNGGQKRILEHALHQPRPSNLIRRDDSWQSLVSLTRVGKVAPFVACKDDATGPVDERVRVDRNNNDESNVHSTGIEVINNDARRAINSEERETTAASTEMSRPGRNPLGPIPIAQRSLYARHIMPDQGAQMGAFQSQPQHHQQTHASNQMTSGKLHLESSGPTPSRASPFLARQHSIGSRSPLSTGAPATPGDQVQARMRREAQLSLLGHHQAMSLDAAHESPSAERQPHQMSYHKKLVQLQMLHLQNHNADYGRHGDYNSSDYQIYAPESATTSHYYYSSMRSNMKLAASEFSFIRPTSVHDDQSLVPHFQRGQPNNRSFVHPTSNGGYVLDSGGTRLERHGQELPINEGNRSSVPFVANQQPFPGGDPSNNSGIVHGEVGKQFLVNPATGERLALAVQSAAVTANQEVLPEQEQLIAPTRELPIIPNKKRPASNNNGSGQAGNGAKGDNSTKNSSLTSSIACFFRRAFSRRSKRRSKRNKLTESCSSSLGVFEDSAFPNLPIVTSAFSTGSKSADGVHNALRKQPQQQQQRMVDMIEVFQSAVSAAASDRSQTKIEDLGDLMHNPKQAVSDAHHLPASPTQLHPSAHESINLPNPHLRRPQINLPSGSGAKVQAGASPLHKSNSICATMGLSVDSHGQVTRRSFMSHGGPANEFGAPLPPNGPFLARAPMTPNSNQLRQADLMVARDLDGSPMLVRRPQGGKVFAAVNVTPSREPLSIGEQQQQLKSGPMFSPRCQSARVDGNHLPRPSSIYGQPSMIASPSTMITRDASGQFGGPHRNSMHDRPISCAEPPGFMVTPIFADQRFSDQPAPYRRQMGHSKMISCKPLDPTRELAEDGSASPCGEELEPLADSVGELPIKPGAYTGGRGGGAGPSSFGSHGPPPMPPVRHSLDLRDLGASPVLLEHHRHLHHYHHQSQISDLPNCGPSPAAAKHYQINRGGAIVNPISNSPIMTPHHTIYDNHPSMLPDGSDSSQGAIYSHYDNHHHHQRRPSDYQHHQKAMHQSPSMGPMITRASAQGLATNSKSMQQFTLLSSGDHLASGQPLADHYDNASWQRSQAYEPLTTNCAPRSSVSVLMGPKMKPSAIVAPSTPNKGPSSLDHTAVAPTEVAAVNRSPRLNGVFRAQSLEAASVNSRSPLMSHRVAGGPKNAQQPQVYQLSPLIGRNTCSVNQSDGVQTTVIGERPPNFDPAVTASIMRRTNIKAYESSTFDRNRGQPLAAFKIGTRLTKSQANSNESPHRNGSNASAQSSHPRDYGETAISATDAVSTGRHSTKSSTNSVLARDFDDMSSTTSSSRRSVGSFTASERGSLTNKDGSKFIGPKTYSQEDQSELDGSRGSSLRDRSCDRGRKGSNASNGSQENRDPSNPLDLKREKVGPSSRPKHRLLKQEPDEKQTDHEKSGSIKSEKRNWITSKLAQ